MNKRQNRQFTEETQTAIITWKIFNVTAVNEIQAKLKENLRLVCLFVFLLNPEKFEKGRLFQMVVMWVLSQTTGADVNWSNLVWCYAARNFKTSFYSVIPGLEMHPKEIIRNANKYF